MYYIFSCLYGLYEESHNAPDNRLKDIYSDAYVVVHLKQAALLMEVLIQMKTQQYFKSFLTILVYIRHAALYLTIYIWPECVRLVMSQVGSALD